MNSQSKVNAENAASVNATGDERTRFSRPELLAPAGDWECARAAVENGADAIYFGLDCGFNARHRAQNFHLDDLHELMPFLHRRGVRGYTTMNTLVFPSELPRLVPLIETLASTGVDAVLVQDFGVARLVREICPDLEVHASTQMSLTSAETIAAAESLGIRRVVLARELSVKEISQIAGSTSMPLEVFIHGALCVAYSGQCLTSESLGGRSANRGQCAQACRLPYEVVSDGNEVDLGDVRYLLSPQDLAGYDSIVALVQAGIASLKIEGRLKTPEYVANITGHYRRAIDQAVHEGIVSIDPIARQEMELSFSRGFSPGWLEGNDHKRLVPGLQSAKRGIRLGRVERISNDRVLTTLEARLALGDGLGIESTERQGSEQAMQGGRVYSIELTAKKSAGDSVKSAESGVQVWIGFGRGEIDWSVIEADGTIFKNDDPKLNKRLRQTFESSKPATRIDVDFQVNAVVGRPLTLTATVAGVSTDAAVSASMHSDQTLEAARKHPADEAMLRDKLQRLGTTQFQLRHLDAHLEDGPMVPASLLNELRRQVIESLDRQLASPPNRRINVKAGERLLAPIQRDDDELPSQQREPASSPKLAVLCRTLEQVKTVAQCDVDLVYADFHDIRQYAEVAELCHPHQTPFGIATVRMQKPGETGLLRVLRRHQADVVLARNLAAIDYFRDQGVEVVADFSLNIANHRAAEWIRSLGAVRTTASYDLNRDQLGDLVQALPSEWLEVVLQQHIPMFHMEHCVFCSVLSPGTNKTNCGRPCDRHVVELRDRVGALHPLHADVACRNTLYNATPQSGAETASELLRSGVHWFRVELLGESPGQTKTTIDLYRRLLSGEVDGATVWRTLKATNRLGVTRGTLESKRHPLAVL